MGDAHDELATARALQVDVLEYGALVAGFERAEFGGLSLFLAHQRDGINGVRGIAQQIENGGGFLIRRRERNLFIAAADVEHVEIVELVALALDGDDASATD